MRLTYLTNLKPNKGDVYASPHRLIQATQNEGHYDAILIGSGIGSMTTAALLTKKGGAALCLRSIMRLVDTHIFQTQRLRMGCGRSLYRRG